MRGRGRATVRAALLASRPASAVPLRGPSARRAGRRRADRYARAAVDSRAPSDADPLRELAGDGMALAGNLDGEGTVEGRVRQHDDALVRQEAELGEVAEEARVAVRHAADDGLGAARELAQRPVVLLGQLELGRGDRIAVRIARRVAEGRIDARLERLREVVLEALGLGMHLVPGKAERLHQIE